MRSLPDRHRHANVGLHAHCGLECDCALAELLFGIANVGLHDHCGLECDCALAELLLVLHEVAVRISSWRSKALIIAQVAIA